MKVAIKFILFVGIFLFASAFLLKDRLPPQKEILKELYLEPVQTKTTAAVFKKEVAGLVYTIEPVYDYELYGLVVSYHYSSVWWDMEHRKKGDLNPMDLGVIWGDNIKSGVYRYMKFTSGSWTLYSDFKFGVNFRKDVYDIASKYKSSCLSNNHVIFDNDRVGKLMKSAESGDQVWMKGYLVNYTAGDYGGWWRRSSTTRQDNLCEVVYVKDFKILKKANPFWRSVYHIAKISLLMCLILYVIIFIRESCKLY